MQNLINPLLLFRTVAKGKTSFQHSVATEGAANELLRSHIISLQISTHK